MVGQSLLDQLTSDDFYDSVIVLSRRQITLGSNKAKLVIVDFDDLESSADSLHAHHYFCCLGTTLKKAGSKEAFFKVDYSYCIKLAGIAAESSMCEQFHIVTSLGANSDSVIYYNKVKGMLEDSLKKMTFSALYIYQPSLLIGHRDERRTFEEIAKFVSKVLTFFMIGSNGRKFLAIDASRVAKGMLVSAKKGPAGIHTFPSRVIEKLTAVED